MRKAVGFSGPVSDKPTYELVDEIDVGGPFCISSTDPTRILYEV